jgi:hypothetical protein
MASDTRIVKWKLRIPNKALVALYMFALPVLCHAKNNCPWINEATTGGLLGGTAVNEFTDATASQPAVCKFTYDGPGVTRTLVVTVEVAAAPKERLAIVARTCGPDAAPLQAIGNEAQVCMADVRRAGPGERVVGRVRDQVFTITLSSTLKNDPLLTRDELRARIYTAAEQVAGNLF